MLSAINLAFCFKSKPCNEQTIPGIPEADLFICTKAARREISLPLAENSCLSKWDLVLFDYI